MNGALVLDIEVQESEPLDAYSKRRNWFIKTINWCQGHGYAELVAAYATASSLNNPLSARPGCRFGIANRRFISNAFQNDCPPASFVKKTKVLSANAATS